MAPALPENGTHRRPTRRKPTLLGSGDNPDHEQKRRSGGPRRPSPAGSVPRGDVGDQRSVTFKRFVLAQVTQGRVLFLPGFHQLCMFRTGLQEGLHLPGALRGHHSFNKPVQVVLGNGWSDVVADDGLRSATIFLPCSVSATFRRARDKRDIAVPIGTPGISETSAQENTFNCNQHQNRTAFIGQQVDSAHRAILFKRITRAALAGNDFGIFQGGEPG